MDVANQVATFESHSRVHSTERKRSPIEMNEKAVAWHLVFLHVSLCSTHTCTQIHTHARTQTHNWIQRRSEIKSRRAHIKLKRKKKKWIKNNKTFRWNFGPFHIAGQFTWYGWSWQQIHEIQSAGLAIVMYRLFQMTRFEILLRYTYVEVTLFYHSAFLSPTLPFHSVPLAPSLTPPLIRSDLCPLKHMHTHDILLLSLCVCLSLCCFARLLFLHTYCGSINMMPLIICAYRHVLVPHACEFFGVHKTHLRRKCGHKKSEYRFINTTELLDCGVAVAIACDDFVPCRFVSFYSDFYFIWNFKLTER